MSTGKLHDLHRLASVEPHAVRRAQLFSQPRLQSRPIERFALTHWCSVAIHDVAANYYSEGASPLGLTYTLVPTFAKATAGKREMFFNRPLRLGRRSAERGGDSRGLVRALVRHCRTGLKPLVVTDDGTTGSALIG